MIHRIIIKKFSFLLLIFGDISLLSNPSYLGPYHVEACPLWTLLLADSLSSNTFPGPGRGVGGEIIVMWNNEQTISFVQTWKMQYGKTYSNSEATAGLGELSQEESFRMKVWIENKADIQKHNRQFYKVKKAA